MPIILILKWIFLYGKLGTTLVEELLPRIPVWPTILIVTVLSIYGYGHHSCEVAHQNAQIQLEKKNDKVETSVKLLSPSELDKRLRRYRRD